MLLDVMENIRYDYEGGIFTPFFSLSTFKTVIWRRIFSQAHQHNMFIGMEGAE